MSLSLVQDFTAGLGFALDAFQQRAIDSLSAGRSVLVAAPTGAGKTVVGEFACHDATVREGRAFYTTPIKALSNQKFRDLVDRYGADNVGLLTGDRSINPSATVVVMTTEVLRNMIYESSSALNTLRHVILDEVHYLADRERGAVWEEVIIQLDQRVQLTALSATVSNAESFGQWLDQVRHGCDVIIEERRPVPLRHHYFVNGRIYPTFRAGNKKGASAQHRERAAQALAGVPNPDVMMLERQARQRNRVSNRGRRLASSVRLRWPSRPEVIAELAHRKWLPVIVFVFSRAGCDAAVDELVRSGVRLTTTAEQQEIDVIVDTMLSEIPAVDLAVLGMDGLRAALRRGIAAHHAGMIPAFKETVEVLFQRGLLKVVVATETLALGINMPARTVVIERLEKYNGESHVMLTAGQYTQLTGRAGRRGIDDIGHAVVLHQRDVDFKSVAGLVGTRSYPLRSSFLPSYNMAVNLLRHHDLERAHELLAASFAQFEADAGVSRKVERLRELERGIGGYAPNVDCDHGDWQDYWSARRQLNAAEKDQARQRKRAADDEIRSAIARLQPGDVVRVPDRPDVVAVIGIQYTKGGVPLAQIVGTNAALQRIGPRELAAAPHVVDRIRLPKSGNPRQRDFRKVIAATLRSIDSQQTHGVASSLVEDRSTPDDDRATIAALRDQVTSHPCHGCSKRAEHERWQYRIDELERDVRQLRDDVARATGSLVRRFDRILRVLTDMGYLDDVPQPTEDGMRLARIYSEVDLLIAELVKDETLLDATAAELAAVAAYVLYEPRSDEPAPRVSMPTTLLDRATGHINQLADGLRHRERQAGLPPMRELDLSFVVPIYRWAHGADLDVALGDLDITGGDFVRNVKQAIDLLGQLRHVGVPALTTTAETAMDLLRRGIVDA